MARSISTPPIRDASPSQVTPLQLVRFPQQLACTDLYSWMERFTVRVKCLAQKNNKVKAERDPEVQMAMRNETLTTFFHPSLYPSKSFVPLSHFDIP